MRPTPPRGLARVVLGLPASPMGTAFMVGGTRTQDGSLGSRTLRPLWQDSGKTRPGQPCDWEAAIRDPPLPCTAGLPSLPLSWGMGTQHLAWPASAWPGPSSSPPRGHSLFILPSSPSTRHCPGTFSSPVPCTSLSPFYLLGRGRGEGTGEKRFTLSWGEGGVTVIMVCPLHLARGQT